MVDVNDTNRNQQKLDNRIQQDKDAAIADADRDAILAFADFRRYDGKSRTTRTNDLSTLRCAAERSPVPLTEATMSNIEDLFISLVKSKGEGGYGLKPGGGGMYNYKRSLRIFFRWMDGRDDRPDYPFWERITPPKMDAERQTEDDRLTREEIRQLSRATCNPRDRALIAFLADGHRVTMATQLRVGDVHPYGSDAYFTPNGTAKDGHKKMSNDPRPLIWSKSRMGAWLSHDHPDPENPDAPLWPIRREYDPENPSECAVSADRVRDMLHECARRAGIPKSKVHPHNFRHAAMTRLRRDEKLPDHSIQHLAGWRDPRMVENYDETTTAERNDSIRAGLGMETAGDIGEPTPEPEPCWNCTIELTDERFCPNCGEPQEVSARLARKNARTDIRESLTDDANDPNRTAARVAVLEALENPETLEALSRALEGATD